MTEEQRIAAVAAFMGTDPEEYDYDCDVVVSCKKEYLVLTNEEADELAKSEIKELLWAFNPDFIATHCKTHLPETAIKALESMQSKIGESCNGLIEALIEDMDEFVRDAVLADGRGHFLATYDGEEQEVVSNGIAFYIYRLN